MRRRQTPPMTPRRAAIAKFLVQKLGLYQHQAAALLGINQGRVSEVITGKKHKNVPAADQHHLNLD